MSGDVLLTGSVNWSAHEETDISLVTHLSPVEWDNVLPYGEYVIDRELIQ